MISSLLERPYLILFFSVGLLKKKQLINQSFSKPFFALFCPKDKKGGDKKFNAKPSFRLLMQDLWP